ncbi:hypothetical protein N7G274_002510 [Stereocaulon virgatum]|uniref:Uncharacterized protein n=1 Tax=Stereocaulon virgatum TaxID=373712 RepID=A0ABR4AG51_9LECA
MPIATERLVLRCLTQPILHLWGKMLISKVVLMAFAFSIRWFDRQFVACAGEDSLVNIIQAKERYGFTTSYKAAPSSALSGLSVAPIAFPSARGHSSASNCSTSTLAHLVFAVKWRSYSTYAYNFCLSSHCWYSALTRLCYPGEVLRSKTKWSKVIFTQRRSMGSSPAFCLSRGSRHPELGTTTHRIRNESMPSVPAGLS